MSSRIKELAPLLAVCAALGIAIDFIFNGVFIGFLFGQPFTEKLAFFYIPLLFAGAMTLANRLMHDERRRAHTKICLVAFVVGAFLGHVLLVGHRGTRTYTMMVDQGYGSILLRSSDWPQILFVTSDDVKRELNANYTGKREVPVLVDIVSDYGCDRSAVIRTVAGVDVRRDPAATWTWQVDRQSGGKVSEGPGTESARLFWCRRPPPIRDIENNPGTRPWEQHPASTNPS